MGKLPGDKLARDLRQWNVAFSIVEHVLAGLDIGQALVDVHTAAVDAKDGLGHEGGEQTMFGGDTLDGVLEGDRVVGGVQRMFVTEVDFVLADGDFVMAHFDMDLQGQQGLHDVAAHALRFVFGREVEITADIVRDAALGAIARGTGRIPVPGRCCR